MYMKNPVISIDTAACETAYLIRPLKRLPGISPSVYKPIQTP